MKKISKKLKKWMAIFLGVLLLTGMLLTVRVSYSIFFKKPPVKISVIVPVYNTAPYLKRCLDSILHQTLKDIEIICINDGSTDHSKDILKTYAKKDKRIVLIDFEKNKGVAAARNEGMKHAKGKFIGFVDSDDFIDEKHFENLYRHRKKADIVKGIVLRNGNIIPHKKYGQIIGTMVRRKFWLKKNVVFPPMRKGEDKVFYQMLKKNNARIKFLKDNGIYYHYEYRLGSAMKWKPKDFVCRKGYIPKVW